MELGIEIFIREKKWQGLQKHRVAFLGHSASVDSHLKSSLSLILTQSPIKVSCILSPQHGFYGVEQANMITTEDEPAHPVELNPCVGNGEPRQAQMPDTPSSTKHLTGNKTHRCPVFSLYSSKNRRLTPEMLAQFDTLIVDLQDVGCRVYTYLTTLFYILEDLEHTGKEIWILDRPNPVGRKIEGAILNPDFLSFVGAGPLPLRHGLTLGEAALWYRSLKNLNVDLQVIKMKAYFPEKAPWPSHLPWVLPSPNMTDRECALCYSGTVLLEGTNISEARGTVFPLKAFGWPNKPAVQEVLKLMVQTAPQWLRGCVLRKEFFKPQFDKFQNQVCAGLRIYASAGLKNETSFTPYRLVSLFLKCLKKAQPDLDWKKAPPYEYEYEKWPIDILSGDDFLRQWVENPDSSAQDLEKKLGPDETLWAEQRKPFLLY